MKSFEQRLKELEQINEQLKSSETPLEEALQLFEQGVKTVKNLEKELKEAERKVEILLKDEQGNEELKPFDEGTDQ